jgi:phage terminase small subunit
MARGAVNPQTGVTAQQEEFARLAVLLGDHNRAYRAAYNAENMSQVSVRAAASRLRDKATVVQRIQHWQALADRKLEVSVERIAKELARVGFVDPADLYDEKGEVIPVHMLPEDVRRAISSVKTTLKGREIRFWNKNEALHTMGKWKRMVVDKVEIVDPNDPQNLTDEQLEAELRALDETLKVIDAAKARAQKKTKA